MTKIIAIANRKGGVGKTTTAVNLAAGLARMGSDVLLIDTDSQANATALLADNFRATLYHALTAPDIIAPRACVYQVREHMWIMPADRRLLHAQRMLAADDNFNALQRIVDQLREFVIIIDTPPSEEALFYNALRAATDVIIPIKMSYLAYIGAGEMMKIAGQLGANVAGLLPTFYDHRRQMDRGLIILLEQHFPDLMLSPVRQNTALNKAQAQRQSIFEYAPGAPGAQDYLELIARYA